MTWLLSLPGKIAMAALALTLAYGAGYMAGKSAAKNSTLKGTVKAHENRNEIDRDVDGLDAYRRCIELGGMPDRCNELRGLEGHPEPE